MRVRIQRATSETTKTKIAEPIMQGINGTPASSGPTPPIKFTPSQPPIMPTTAEVKNPPGTVFGTKRSAIAAQTAATTKNKINQIIDILFLFLDKAANDKD